MSERFTDQELKQAAHAVARSMEAAFDGLPEVKYEYSAAYDEKMDALLHRVRRRELTLAVLRRTAAVFAAMIIGFSAWMAADVDARAAFTGWGREVYEDSVLYRFSGEGRALTRLPVYEVTWIPEGMAEVVRGVNRSGRYSVYNDKGERGVYFFYSEYNEETVLELGYIDSAAEGVYDIHGLTASFYPAADHWQSNSLFWVDESRGILFLLNGNLGAGDMVAMAEQIVLVEK